MPFKKWRATRVDAAGNTKAFTLRGPSTEADALRLATQAIAHTPTVRALRSGAKDPGLKVTKVEFVGEEEGEFGQFAPANAKPVDLEEFSDKNPDGTAKGSVAEKLAAEA